MKRSAMILRLMEILVEAPEDVEKAANYILTRLEKAGMKPPTIILDPNSYNRSEGTYGYEANEWEPENDI